MKKIKYLEGNVQLGDRVRDKLSGFQGIVIGITYWLHNCIRIGVSPEEMKDGKPVESQWFDEPQLGIIEKHAFLPSPPAEFHRPVSEPQKPIRMSGGPARETGNFHR